MCYCVWGREWSRARGMRPAAAPGPLVGLRGCRLAACLPPPPRLLAAALRGARATRAEQRRSTRQKENGPRATASPRRPGRRRGGLVFRHPSRWPRRLARRRHRRRHPASRRRRQQRRLHLRLLRFQRPARASRRCACARALVLGAPSNPVNRRRTSGRCHTPPCAAPGRLCGHARARPMRANSLPTSIGPSWT